MKTFRSADKHRKNSHNKKLFSKYMQEKLAITVLVITLALSGLVVVLYQIVRNNKEEYKQIVLTQKSSYDSRTLPYRRGDIKDRNGTYLATSDKVYNLIIDPTQIMYDPGKYLDPTVDALAASFEYDREELKKLIQDNKDKPYIRYDRQLTYDQKNGFETLAAQTNDGNKKAKTPQRVKGIWFEEEYKRNYPYGSLACSVIGFASGDGTGGSGGIEQYYNNMLIGVNGRQYGYLNDDSNLECVIKSPSNGNTIVSTIDVKVQSIVEKYVDEWMKETGSNGIGVIVMNPNNGEILAMATDKVFNLNNPRDLTGYPEENLIALGEKEAIDDYRRKNSITLTAAQIYEYYTREEVKSLGQQVAWNQRWRNFCVSDTYEPGSPSKIFTISAALEEGVISGTETYLCDGVQNVGGWKIKCVNRNGHGLLAVPETLMVSCNDAMMQIAAQTGREKFYKYQHIFGFGSKTGIDLPAEADAGSLVHTAENANSSDLATNAFGQNYTCTMVQMAAAYCSVINGGSYYEPHVVKQIQNDQGAVVKRVEPKLVRETVSESTSNFIKTALNRTVNDTKGKIRGTGGAAAIEGYEIGGKTGTAEKIPRNHKDYLVSFAGFAPADNPQVFTYVVIDQPHTEEQAHSTYASTVFSKIMKEILPYLNVTPSTELSDAPAEVESQLPKEEGITSGEGGIKSQTQETQEGETTEESKPQLPEGMPNPTYADEEFVDPEAEGSGLPAGVPGETDAAVESKIGGDEQSQEEDTGRTAVP